MLRKALLVFAREGFHAASMEDIADAAGVTKPVLYQHFASKRKLYQELLDDISSSLMAAITEATSSAGGPRQQVERGFAAYFRFVADNRDAFTLLFGSGGRRDAEFADYTRRVEATIAEAVARLIDADLDDDHRRLLAYGIVGMAEGTSRHFVAEGVPVDADAAARRLAELAWAGLRAVKRD